MALYLGRHLNSIKAQRQTERQIGLFKTSERSPGKRKITALSLLCVRVFLMLLLVMLRSNMAQII